MRRHAQMKQAMAAPESVMNACSKNNPTSFMVAGTHSGVGRTTVTLTLLRAILASGSSVQPFKLGPDFIDSAYHGEVAGRPSVNLDL
jgi:cobyrinic acid a,c-diamide synthase